MSNIHEDRVAERKPHQCAAYGCPLLGTSTTSTQGTNEWWCFAHFGASVGNFQRITAELRALEWLSTAVFDVRTMQPGSNESRAAMARIRHDFEFNGRKDLLIGDHERRHQWLLRLETELRRLVVNAVQPAPRQAPIMPTVDTGTFGKVEFDLPEMA